MTQESQAWLEQNVRVGFTAPEHGRGNSWWYQGDGESQYPHAVPAEEVKRVLSRANPATSPVYVEAPDQPYSEPVWGIDEVEPGKIRVPGLMAITRADDGHVYQVTTDGYRIHDYEEWLVDYVERATDTKLQIGSVMLLRDGAIAAVQMEFPETLQHAGTGEAFRPFIGATTSLDSSLATQYKKGTIRVVCDNTRDAFFSGTPGLRRRHTSNSTANASDIRKALGIQLEQVADDYMAELDALSSVDVSPKQWDRFLEIYIPLPEEGKGRTRASNRREALDHTYKFDTRVAPWAGTQWGVLQAVSTFDQHEATVRQTKATGGEGDAARVERNYLSFLKGQFAKEEKAAMDALTTVLDAPELVAV